MKKITEWIHIAIKKTHPYVYKRMKKCFFDCLEKERKWQKKRKQN